jgi:mevalonate kinase
LERFYSNGKLLITGEYLVLDGALALAIPTRFGQSMEVAPLDENIIKWTAKRSDDSLWFEHEISINSLLNEVTKESLPEEGSPQNTLEKILRKANFLNPDYLKDEKGLNISTKLDFPNNWGLGSSSTLINNIAQLFNINPYSLLRMTFGGSGYDIAAAQVDNPITFQITGEENRVLSSNFDPVFKDQLFFVHLNKKQNSRDSIKHYKDTSSENLYEAIEKVSALTERFIACQTIEEFKLLIEIHETLISKIINTPKVKTELFPDFSGAIKSLGGWGGDFVLATGGQEEQEYFKAKGYTTIISYQDMIK